MRLKRFREKEKIKLKKNINQLKNRKVKIPTAGLWCG